MDEAQPFYRDPHKILIIASLMVIVIYLVLMGRQGEAIDVTYNNGIAYVSVGSHGGVRILDMNTPSSPHEVGHYDSPGQAYRSAFANGRLFLADGSQGLRILDVSNPATPILNGSLKTPGEALQVAVFGNYAYVAMGRAGLLIADVSNPNQPFQVAQLPIQGSALAVGVAQVASPVSSNGYPPAGPGVFVYVASGGGGLQVVDARLPIAPAVINAMDVGGSAGDIIVVAPYALVAAGDGGLVVLSLTNPIVPVIVSNYKPESGSVQRLALSGSRVYLAMGSNGVQAVDVTNPAFPQKILAYQTPAAVAQAVAEIGPYAMIAEGAQGMSVIETNTPAGAMQVGLYETPGEASPLQILRGVFTAITGHPGAVQSKVWRSLLMIVFDLILFILLMLLWLAFYAQFALPVHSLSDRRRAVDRLISYHLGSRGPAIFVENGRSVERNREEYRSGPGVALLDTASAAVFRTRHAFTRPAGPGITFTNPGEYLAGTVDLHRQSESLGPRGEENPFKPTPEETPAEAALRQERRYQTSALTRDGVEVVPNISVSFKIDSQAGEGRTLFGYNPDAVWKAIAGAGIDPSADPSSDKRHIDWKYLPPYIAADLWREYLRKFTLDELFAFSAVTVDFDSGQRKTAFDLIIEKINQRMKNETVMELDENGKPTGRMIRSREYEILEKRGITVQSANVSKLHFEEGVESQLVEQWKATWLERARREMKEVEEIQSEKRMRGQDEAARNFALSASQPLDRELKADPELGLKDTLEQLVKGTLALCNKSELQPRMTIQKASLSELIEWIRKQA